MPKYIVLIDCDYIRDAQIDVNYSKDIEELCSNGPEDDEEEDRIADYEDRQWNDICDSDIVLEIIECDEDEFEGELSRLLEHEEIPRKIVKVLKTEKLEEVFLDGI